MYCFSGPGVPIFKPHSLCEACYLQMLSQFSGQIVLYHDIVTPSNVMHEEISRDLLQAKDIHLRDSTTSVFSVFIRQIMPTLPPTPPSIVRIGGPLLFGGLLNWFLSGVLVVQCYVYSYNFPQDKRHLKMIVYIVLFLETIQTVLNGADLYYWFISGYGDLTHLSSPFASSFDVPIIESVVSLTVEFFFAYGIWVLSSQRSGWFCSLICLVGRSQAS
ncbi:hypothetical protein F5148DRAFT_521619 [Russula earlei]|uniref:Uncharacterized protein n=1 Tax=Russula earlei TaxID=71964 RepID=A0ACC0TXT7_9AGAM|nr:hypothetical protein F5148DRAFT_521619 [Russula earlei]